MSRNIFPKISEKIVRSSQVFRMMPQRRDRELPAAVNDAKAACSGPSGAPRSPTSAEAQMP
ncbi:hypothetical protein AOQ84DRAFT_351825 [Glonium stellatum]|uniref:Uncharacterized protein n=1 Tax=Glonium stellatum TaxID=574774 RepID=A0A8E2FAW1_9PEZI|nr:hypothetical protein AOQ84DRAFT_351825 [Glonium stellatum]